MNEKQYILSDGAKYIKINPQGDPVKTPNVAFAHVFNNAIEANTFLQSQCMVKLNKDNGKTKFNLEIYDSLPPAIRTNEDKQLVEEIIKEIDELDGTYKDFEGLKLPDKNNNHVYSGKTTMEDDDFDLLSFMRQSVTVFSSLDVYAENMAYMEQEIDLKLLDIRHYKRDTSTRLNAIAAQQLEYLEQDLERERVQYKKNKIIASLFTKDIKRIKNKAFLKILGDIYNIDYKYKRINKDDIEEMIRTRKVNLKAV
jgi:hypothetical protein